MSYRHIQYGPLYCFLMLMAGILLINTWLVRESRPHVALIGGVAILFVLLAFCFHRLIVADQGEFLAVRFGPFPIFGKRIRYADITSAEAGRSSLLDGLGVHYFPGRGWTYNIWGADCVVVRLGPRIIRIGSDDVPGLLAFLRTRIKVGS